MPIPTENSGKSSGDADGAGSAATLLGPGGLLAASPSKDSKSMMDPDLVLASASNLENQVTHLSLEIPALTSKDLPRFFEKRVVYVNALSYKEPQRSRLIFQCLACLMIDFWARNKVFVDVLIKFLLDDQAVRKIENRRRVFFYHTENYLVKYGV